MPPSFKLEALLASRNSRGYLEGARVTVGLLLAQTHARTNRNSLSLTLESHFAADPPSLHAHACTGAHTDARKHTNSKIYKEKKKENKKKEKITRFFTPHAK